MFSGDSMRQFGAKDQTCERRTTGTCIMQHSSQLTHTFLTKHGITTIRQPTYSSDLAPSYFWLFPKLKTSLKGSRFESKEEIMRNATMEQNTIPKEDFQRCFQQWKDRWARCVEAQGIYFEED
nr:histone-lysine N-methyltransferase SETMAR-like [Parasteatoda tepidariorum]